MKIIFLFLLLALASQVNAGAKGDFVAAVKQYCGKSDGDAKALATPGRSGNVIKLKTCTSDNVKISDDCTLPCKDASASIGG